MTVRATFQKQSLFLFTEAGEQLARRWFTEEEIASLGVYGKRSKHAGKPRGMIRWVKVVSGGWVSTGSYEGHVENRVGEVIEASLMQANWGEEPKVVATVETAAPATPRWMRQNECVEVYRREPK